MVKMDKRFVDGMCMDCKFYYDEELPQIGCGECRCNPPTPMYDGRHSPYAMGVFPVIGEYGWCFKFEEKKEE